MGVRGAAIAKQKGPAGMVEAVKSSKKKQEQDETRRRLVKAAER